MPPEALKFLYDARASARAVGETRTAMTDDPIIQEVHRAKDELASNRIESQGG